MNEVDSSLRSDIAEMHILSKAGCADQQKRAAQKRRGTGKVMENDRSILSMVPSLKDNRFFWMEHLSGALG